MSIFSKNYRSRSPKDENFLFSRLNDIFIAQNPAAYYNIHLIRGVAQPGSASAWGAGGRRFKSCRPDQSS
jgi:hypothetical protein